MNYSHLTFPTLRSSQEAKNWQQAEQYSFKNITVKSRLLVNKSKISRKRTTGGHCIESMRGSGNMT